MLNFKIGFHKKEFNLKLDFWFKSYAHNNDINDDFHHAFNCERNCN